VYFVAEHTEKAREDAGRPNADARPAAE
jgi:hypothetical protein